MNDIRRIAVYCGSRMGHSPAYAQAAVGLAQTLAQAGIGIVYGGSRNGLMGVLADAALAAGGEVIGVIPDLLNKNEHAHPGLTHLYHVSSMHERKALMAQLADAFIALPGGVGTLDELIEIWCWAGMGSHAKPCGCLDVNNYWQPLFDLLAHIQHEGFAHGERQLLRSDHPQRLLALMAKS